MWPFSFKKKEDVGDERERFSHFKVQWTRPMGPQQAVDYVRLRFGIEVERSILETELGMQSISKNSTTYTELDSWVYHICKDKEQILKSGGILSCPSGLINAHGYPWKIISIRE